MWQYCHGGMGAITALPKTGDVATSEQSREDVGTYMPGRGILPPWHFFCWVIRVHAVEGIPGARRGFPPRRAATPATLTLVAGAGSARRRERAADGYGRRVLRSDLEPGDLRIALRRARAGSGAAALRRRDRAARRDRDDP